MRVVVYDDEPRLREMLISLIPEGEVQHVSTRQDLKRALSEPPDLLVMDVYFRHRGALEGIYALEEVLTWWQADPFTILVVSRYLDTEVIGHVRHLRHRYPQWEILMLEHEIHQESYFVQELEKILARAQRKGQDHDRRVIQWYENQQVEGFRFVVRSPALQQVLWRIEEILETYTFQPLTLLGETGVGKTRLARLVAQRMWEKERRQGNPTVVVLNCARFEDMDGGVVEAELFGMPRGMFGNYREIRGAVSEVSEEGGVLVLDEFQYLPPKVQRRLLHLLDREPFFHPVGSEKAHPFRGKVVLCSTLTPAQLRERVDAALWNRLRPGVVEIPPLRERREDIQAFLEANVEGSQRTVISNRARRYLVYEYPWWGNMRELVQAALRFLRHHYVDFSMVYPSPMGDESLPPGHCRAGGRNVREEKEDLVAVMAHLEKIALKERLSLEDVTMLWIGYLLERYRSVDRILEIFRGGQGFSRATLFRKRDEWARRENLRRLLGKNPPDFAGFKNPA